MRPIEARCYDEILELHDFFVEWFTEKLPQTDEAFARLTEALAEGMVLISPAGTTQSREQILAWIRQSYGIHASMLPPFRLWIDDFQFRHHSNGLALVTYVEWQEVNGQINSRQSSALFQKKVGAPNDIVWLHVHETDLSYSD